MPRSRRYSMTELPGTLQRSCREAQETFLRALDEAVRTHGAGDQAHRVAYATLKQSSRNGAITGLPRTIPRTVAPAAQSMSLLPTTVDELAAHYKSGGQQIQRPVRLDHGARGSTVRFWWRRHGGSVMANVGYTLMTEQAGPKDLVQWAVRAEETGFDLLVSSDHYFPWLDEQGHAPNAWVTLGAVAQATERAELMTYVTCPTMRYHPAVVAQQAATLALLSDSRFTLGLGAGENLNEHVIGEGWPDADQRQDMLTEAVSIIRALLNGGYVNFQGSHFRVDAARIWDLPDGPVPLGVAVSGQQSCELFAPLADVMIAVEPDGSLAGWWDAASNAGQPARKVGQMPICWGPDQDECIGRAHEQFRWFGGGWKVNAELPGTAGFAAPPVSSGPRTSPARFPAAIPWTRWPRRRERSSRPDLPTSRWFRSAAPSRSRTASSRPHRN